VHDEWLMVAVMIVAVGVAVGNIGGDEMLLLQNTHNRQEDSCELLDKDSKRHSHGEQWHYFRG
jgi:hypothetical protein